MPTPLVCHTDCRHVNSLTLLCVAHVITLASFLASSLQALEMLKAGANPNAKCHKGNSALSIAESMKKPDLVALLKKYIK